MGAAASISSVGETNGVSEDCKLFISYFLRYCPVEAKGLRTAAWKSIDFNGNKYVSLAETGKWIEQVLQIQAVGECKAEDKGKGGKTGKSHPGKKAIQDAQGNAKLLYKRFYPCYIRAFLDAADIGKNNGKVKGTKTATKDDFVQRKEFRFLCCYLCIYALMYDAFSVVDGGGEVAEITKDDDRRITLDELKAACGKFKGHPLVGAKLLAMPGSYGNAESIFKQMDTSGGGKVLLSEWCAWMEEKECANKTELGRLLAEAEEDA